MNVPLSWLRSFVDPGVPPDELAHRLTMAGLEVETIDEIGAEWDHVFVGHVRSVDRHPDADRLVLADVEAGDHRLTVVTGAPNVAAGQNVALALAGANLIDGHSDSGQRRVLKPSKVRGILSEGMVCSEKELGLSEEHQGILVLDQDAPVGMALRDYLGDTVFEFEITPNLVHNFSVMGIAREVAALFDAPLASPPSAALDEVPPAPDDLVTIEDVDVCPRYMVISFDGIRIGPSPVWLARRLSNAGVRPINNIVDITNYVMLELGQPLHAFDRSLLSDGRIVVRRARDGERLETLDHLQRSLDSETLVIADAENAMAIAGVMGGVDSEVTPETTTILLEGANFGMTSVRHTSRRLKLRTEASVRFERGLDPNLVSTGMARATELILSICPDSKATFCADVYPNPVAPQTLAMSFDRIEQVLGVQIPDDVVLNVLTRLSFAPVMDDRATLTVSIPTYRQDISIPDDIVEEVARVVGYETLPSTLPWGQAVPVHRDPLYRLQSRVRQAALSAGVSEAMTYVTTSAEVVEQFGALQRESAGLIVNVAADLMLQIINPMQSGRNLLRVSLIPSLIEPAVANLKHSATVQLFEFGRLFQPGDPDGLPHEIEAMAVVIAGDREHVSRFGQPGKLDFFDLKGLIEALLAVTGVSGISFEPASDPVMHPGRAAAVSASGKKIGLLGELLPEVAIAFGFGDLRVGIAELDLEHLSAMLESARKDIRVFRHLPAQQDFAIVVDEAVPAGHVLQALERGAGQLATRFELFDLFRGEQLGEGKKSLAYRVTFTAPDRALTDDDLVKVRHRIERSLKQEVGGILRA